MVASCIAHLEVLDKVCTLAFRVRVQDLDITMALVLINRRRCCLLAEASLNWCEIQAIVLFIIVILCLLSLSVIIIRLVFISRAKVILLDLFNSTLTHCSYLL